MDNVNKEIVEFYKTLGFALVDVKSSVFREEENTLIFQTDSKNHTVDCSTVLYPDAVRIYSELARVVRETEERMVEKIEHLIDDRLPDEMTDAEMEKYHCEGSVLYWGKHLRSAITNLKNDMV